MLTRDQIMTLLLIRKRSGSVLFNTNTPKTIIRNISNIDYDPNSAIAKLLLAIAHDADPATVKKMLDKNPRLLLEAGNVIDAAGNTIMRVTPYECALGAGDDDMAAMIGTYFAKIEGIDGEQEQLRQVLRYEEAIKAMDPKKQQADFDFNPLLQSLIEASTQDVTEELKTDQNKDNLFNPVHKSTLRGELEKLRKHFAPREIKSGMHFNYANLLKAFEVYAKQSENLKKAGDVCDNHNKCTLFWRQVIGTIQRGLPACDRQAFAQGIEFIVERSFIVGRSKKLRRQFNLRIGSGSFPFTSAVDSRADLGFDYAVTPDLVDCGSTHFHRQKPWAWIDLISKHMSNKNNKLAKLIPRHQPEKVKNIGIAYDKLNALTNSYLNKRDIAPKKREIFETLNTILQKFPKQSKRDCIIEYKNKLNEIDKQMLFAHRTPDWKRFVLNVFSILTIIPAIVRMCSNYSKFDTFKFWKPESQKTIECAGEIISKLDVGKIN